MWPLPYILATLTQHDRERVDIHWSSSCLTHNIFRIWELLFWRRSGVRHEFSADTLTGKITAYTWEALIANKVEGPIRRFLRKFEFSRVYVVIPVPAFAGMATAPVKIAYSFAIAFVTSGTQQTAGATPTISLTTSGSNLEMGFFPWVGSGGDVGFSSVTFNGTSSSLLDKQAGNGTSFDYSYHLTAPAVTTANAVGNVSSGTDARMMVDCLSGCSQSGTVDAHAVTTVTTSSTYTATLTTVADNAWIIATVFNNSGDANTAVTGNLRQHANTGQALMDRGPLSPAGTYSCQCSGAGSTTTTGLAFSVAPVASASPTSGFFQIF